MRKNIGKKVGLLIIDYIFRTMPLRKIMSEVFDFNEPSKKIQIANGFTCEATLKEMRFYDGKFWDLKFFSLDRETFYRKKKEVENELQQNSGTMKADE